MAYRKVDIKSFRNEVMLNRNIIIAPSHYNYSLCTNYATRWFKDKFDIIDPNFFSYTHLDGSSAFAEFTRLTKQEMLVQSKDGKATLTIFPEIEDQFNRDVVDLSLFGIDQYIRCARIDSAFMKDEVNHRYLLMNMDLIMMMFSFKIKLPTKSRQLDILKYMRKAFRVSLTETKYIDIDYILPPSVTLTMAKDLGFEIKDSVIQEPFKFLTYLNTISLLPILYKHYDATGRFEFYMRMNDLPVEVRTTSLSKDSGNKTGHLASDFGIDMDIEVKFPAMDMYVYFSKDSGVFLDPKDYIDTESIIISTLHLQNIPGMNEKHWLRFVESRYENDNNNEVLDIDMNDFFSGDILNSIKFHKDKFISPDVFIDLQIYNESNKINCNMNWNTMKLTTSTPISGKMCDIVMYVDAKYFNEFKLKIAYPNNMSGFSDSNNRTL